MFSALSSTQESACLSVSLYVCLTVLPTSLILVICPPKPDELLLE